MFEVLDGSWRSDPWLKHLDWTAVPQQYTQARFKKDGTYAKVIMFSNCYQHNE
jgi:hypothetical protein